MSVVSVQTKETEFIEEAKIEVQDRRAIRIGRVDGDPEAGPERYIKRELKIR